MMRAALHDRYGSPSVLHEALLPVPTPGPGEVRVRVHAAGVNAIDTVLRAGKLRLVTGRRFPRGTGLDFAGVVDTSDSPGYAPGDRVWGTIPNHPRNPAGAAAEYVVTTPDRLAAAPPGVDLADLAALPGVGVTALIALRDHARLRAGQTVLIRGAAGGFGTAALQLAHAAGARVTALASARHLPALRDLGAGAVLDRATTDPAGLGHFDIVLDAAGTELPAYRRHAGRTVTIAWGSIPTLLTIAASAVHGPRRIRSFSATPAHADLALLTDHVTRGDLRPVVAGRFPLTEAAAAHAAFERGGALGKWLIVP
ncbi:NAD(P)-dependent alcohol dehydrogenase [Actinoplanes sp. NPDC000266]